MLIVVTIGIKGAPICIPPFWDLNRHDLRLYKAFLPPRLLSFAHLCFRERRFHLFREKGPRESLSVLHLRLIVLKEKERALEAFVFFFVPSLQFLANLLSVGAPVLFFYSDLFIYLLFFVFLLSILGDLGFIEVFWPPRGIWWLKQPIFHLSGSSLY